MVDAPAIIKRPDGLIWCNVCNKPVDSVALHTPVVSDYLPGRFMPTLRHTGEEILEVSCHGETISISNWRGVVNDPR